MQAGLDAGLDFGAKSSESGFWEASIIGISGQHGAEVGRSSGLLDARHLFREHRKTHELLHRGPGESDRGFFFRHHSFVDRRNRLTFRERLGMFIEV